MFNIIVTICCPLSMLCHAFYPHTSAHTMVFVSVYGRWAFCPDWIANTVTGTIDELYEDINCLAVQTATEYLAHVLSMKHIIITRVLVQRLSSKYRQEIEQSNDPQEHGAIWCRAGDLEVLVGFNTNYQAFTGAVVPEGVCV